MSTKKIIGFTGLALLTTALPAYLIWQSIQLKGLDLSRLYQKICEFDLWIIYKKFDTLLTKMNHEMINKMDFTPFSNSDFMKTLTNKMPDLAGNPDFIKAISDGKLNEFLKTLNHNDQYQLFDIYNKFCKDLPNQTDQMKKFAESFKALEKLHDSGIKSNNMIPCIILIFIATLLISAFIGLIVIPSIQNSVTNKKFDILFINPCQKFEFQPLINTHNINQSK